MKPLHVITTTKTGKPIIALLFIAGMLFILASTYIFTYLIPKIDSELADIDGLISSGEKALTQVQIMEMMSFVPYNIRKIIDILPHPKSYSEVYQEFADEEAKVKRNVVVLLYWPDSPPEEVMKVLPDKNINHLENYKVQLFPQFIDRYNKMVNARRETMQYKQSLRLWSTLLQMIGLIVTQCGVVLQTLRK